MAFWLSLDNTSTGTKVPPGTSLTVTPGWPLTTVIALTGTERPVRLMPIIAFPARFMRSGPRAESISSCAMTSPPAFNMRTTFPLNALPSKPSNCTVKICPLTGFQLASLDRSTTYHLSGFMIRKMFFSSRDCSADSGILPASTDRTSSTESVSRLAGVRKRSQPSR